MNGAPPGDRADRGRASTARGQAFTLEGFVAAAVVLTAVLLTLQAVVAPPERGRVDRQATLEAQASDILQTQASADGGLRRAVRYYDPPRRTFVGAQNNEIGYGNRTLPPELFGRAFDRTFGARGLSYNVVVLYLRPDRSGTRGQEPIRYQGPPGADAVVASHTVTLYDRMTLTGPGVNARELDEFDTDPADGDDSYYPVPDAVDGPVYNVVEVRVTVW